MGIRAAQFVAAWLVWTAGAEDGGGWSLPAGSSFEDEGTCSIDVLDGSELSHQQFLERYAFSRPVILRGLTDNTRFRLRCSRSSLLQNYGSLTVRLMDVLFREYVDEWLRPQSQDALGSETLYFFGDNNFTEWQNLFDQYEAPPYGLPDSTGAYSFGIAVCSGPEILVRSAPCLSLRSRNRSPFPLAWSGILGGHLRKKALVPLPTGSGASFPPEPHHPVLGDRNLSLPAEGGGAAGMHDPARRGSVFSGPLVARHPQPGHQRLHLHLPGLSFVSKPGRFCSGRRDGKPDRIEHQLYSRTNFYNSLRISTPPPV
ncbi:uncharacterized protein jmjd8 isoform 2-T2 [Anableps anableps]